MENWKAVNELITEAIARGEFDNLPGKGKPLDLEDYFRTPEDLRMGMKMVKDAGFKPAEIEVKMEMVQLQEKLEKTTGEEDRKTLKRRILERETQMNILREERLFRLRKS